MKITKKNNINQILISILVLSISFSDINFRLFGGSESSAFPLIILLIYYIINGKINLEMMLIFIYALFFTLISVFNGIRVNVIFVSLAAYLQLIVVFLYFQKYGIEFSLNLCRWIVFTHLTVGLMQYLGGFNVILETPLSIMLERSSVSSLKDIGRGVTFLTTEPSHALQSIIFPIFILSLSLEIKDKIIAGMAIIITIILSSAGVGLVYGLILFLIVFAMRPIYFVAFFGLLMAFSGLYSGLISERAFVVMEYFISIISSSDYISIVELLEFSGFRFPSVIAPIYSLFSFPEKFGIGAWESNIIPSLYKTGFDVENLGHWRYTGDLHPVKPYSVLGNLISDFWWLGSIVFFFYIKYIYKLAKKSIIFKSNSVLPIAICCLAVFSISLLVTIGKPGFVAILGVMAYYNNKRWVDGKNFDFK